MAAIAAITAASTVLGEVTTVSTTTVSAAAFSAAACSAAAFSAAIMLSTVTSDNSHWPYTVQSRVCNLLRWRSVYIVSVSPTFVNPSRDFMTIVVHIFSDLHNSYPNILVNTPNKTNPNVPI